MISLPNALVSFPCLARKQYCAGRPGNFRSCSGFSAAVACFLPDSYIMLFVNCTAVHMVQGINSVVCFYFSYIKNFV